MTNKKISISNGNAKMGAIPSVSLPPVKTCAAGCTCARKCYAAKLCRIYPSVKNAYDRNLDILTTDAGAYWQQVRATAIVARFFRYHVSGDIPNAEYFAQMIETANAAPGTMFLAFTKQYKIVNDYINNGGAIPHNLKIIFSLWDGMTTPNPHGLPTAAVIFKGSEPAPDWKICGGNCSACAVSGAGCWNLKSGETIAFYEH